MGQAVLFKVTEGWTAPLLAQLKIDGASFDGTGQTVSSTVKDKDGTTVAIATAWNDALTSKVSLSPQLTDLVAAKSPYSIKYKVVDGAGKIAYFPQDYPDQIEVHPVV